jgi:hypothetical protein
MANLYGTLEGSRGPATRCGNNQLVTTAATWAGAIRVELSRESGDPAGAAYVVRLIPWHGRGEHRTLAEGRIGEAPPAAGPVDTFTPPREP